MWKVLDNSGGLARIDQSPTSNSDQFVIKLSLLLLDPKIGLIINDSKQFISDDIDRKPSLIQFKMNVAPFCRILPPDVTLQIILFFDFHQFHLALFDVLGLAISYLTLGWHCPQFVTILHTLEDSQMRDLRLRRGEFCYEETFLLGTDDL